MNRIFTFLFVLLFASFSVQSYAQDRPAQVSGEIVDADTGEPLEYATVGLWSTADTTLATGTVSQADGSFLIERARAGDYQLRVSFTGYEVKWVDDIILASGERFEAGEITLREDARALEELVVGAERDFVERRVDRTIYNVREQPVTTGGSVSEILETLPSVEVDMDGNVSFRGDENVRIHINGRPSPVRGEFLGTFLQQLPADAVERVEVIPNPSARHDAEGRSGIINIVMREDRDLGLNGGIQLSGSTNESFGASGNLGLQQGDWSLSGQYGFRHSARASTGFNFRENQFRDPTNFLEQNSNSLSRRNSHMFRGGVDYDISDATMIGYSTMIGYRDNSSEGLNTYEELDHLRDITRRYDRQNEGDQLGLNTDNRINFEHILDRGSHEYTASIRFNTSYNDNANFYLEEELHSNGESVQNLLEEQTNDRVSDQRELDVRADLIRPLWEDGKFEAGYRGTFQRLDYSFYSETLDPEVGQYQPDDHLNNSFVYDEFVHAAYGMLQGESGDFGWQGGLRAELTSIDFNLTTTGEDFDNRYLHFFPSLHFSYGISEGQEVRASYTRRFRRPRTRMLNPFTSFEDPLNISRGNPYLEPQFTDAYELDFSQMLGWGTVTVTPFYRRTSNDISRVTSINEDGVSVTTFDNFDTSESFGLDLVTSVRLGQRVRGYASLSGQRIVTDGSNVASDLRSDAFGWSARGNATVQLHDGLSMQAFVMYRAPRDVERGRISSFSMTNISLQQQFLDDRARLSLSARDVFGQRSFESEFRGDGYYQQSLRNFDSQSIRLSFTYSFGQRDRDRRRDRDRGMDIDDEDMQDPGLVN